MSTPLRHRWCPAVCRCSMVRWIVRGDRGQPASVTRAATSGRSPADGCDDGTMTTHDAPVAVVTGANSGIGRAVAIHLATRGITVYGTVRSADKATKLI